MVLPAVTALALSAQADVAAIRQVVNDINTRFKGLTATRYVAQQAGVEYRSEVKAWADDRGVGKIEATAHDDDGDVVTEYYFADGALVFIYEAIKGYNDAGRQVTRSEERLYFKGGAMLAWRSGMGDVTDNDPKSPDFAEQARSRLAFAAFHFKVAKERVAPSR